MNTYLISQSSKNKSDSNPYLKSQHSTEGKYTNVFRKRIKVRKKAMKLTKSTLNYSKISIIRDSFVLPLRTPAKLAPGVPICESAKISTSPKASHSPEHFLVNIQQPRPFPPALNTYIHLADLLSRKKFRVYIYNNDLYKGKRVIFISGLSMSDTGYRLFTKVI